MNWKISAGREILPPDWGAIAAIAALIHPDLPERPEVFDERRNLFPEGCQALVATSGAIAGYEIAYPWTLHSVPTLDAFVGRLPDKPDCLYVHDVAILPEARGRRGAERYIELIRAAARTKLASQGSLAFRSTGRTRCGGNMGFRSIHRPPSPPRCRATARARDTLTTEMSTRGRSLLREVRPPLACDPLGFGAAPSGAVCVVAGGAARRESPCPPIRAGG